MALRPRWLLAGGLAAAAAVAAAVDALVVTERERVEAFAEAVTGVVDAGRIAGALRYADPDRQPVEVTAFEGTEAYGPGQREALGRRVRAGLRGFEGQRFRTLRRSINVGQGSASVSVQVLSEHGMTQADFVLRRHGRDWLVETARFR